MPGLTKGGILLCAVLGAGCSGAGAGNYGCGFAAVAGQSILLDQFNQPGTVLSELPDQLPAALPVRVALGPAYRSVVGRADSMLIVGVEGAVPSDPPVGFGVLVVSPAGTLQGVVLYAGDPILGAPRLGSVNLGDRDLPLIGLRLELSHFEKASCPIFPDSLRG
jgi:hypothetical protein